MEAVGIGAVVRAGTAVDGTVAEAGQVSAQVAGGILEDKLADGMAAAPWAGIVEEAAVAGTAAVLQAAVGTAEAVVAIVYTLAVAAEEDFILVAEVAGILAEAAVVADFISGGTNCAVRFVSFTS